MSFGVTPEGFNRKLLENVLDELTDDQRSTLSPNINTSAASPHGQLNATFARQCAELWEALELAYHSYDPDKAEDDALIQISKLTGTSPSAATHSRVKCTVNLDNGTTLVRDSHFANVLGNSAARFTIEADYTAVVTGNVDLFFIAEETGAVAANSGTLTVISTGPVGWNSVTNSLDAVLGQPADDDDRLRARRERELARAGSATAKAVKADVEAITIEGGRPVQSCLVVENDTDVDGINGLPRHTIEVVVNDSPTIDNNTIAQVIFDSRSGGIGTAGSVTASATDALGDPHTIKFSRPLDRPIYLTFTISYGPGYVGDLQFASNVVVALDADQGQGEDVFQWTVELAGRQSGVKNLNVTLGFAASPTGESDLVIAARELATFDTSRVVVISTPFVEGS